MVNLVVNIYSDTSVATIGDVVVSNTSVSVIGNVYV